MASDVFQSQDLPGERMLALMSHRFVLADTVLEHPSADSSFLASSPANFFSSSLSVPALFFLHPLFVAQLHFLFCLLILHAPSFLLHIHVSNVSSRFSHPVVVSRSLQHTTLHSTQSTSLASSLVLFPKVQGVAYIYIYIYKQKKRPSNFRSLKRSWWGDEVSIWKVYEHLRSGLASSILETQHLWCSSNFVRKTISIKLCCTRTCPAITRTSNYLNVYFELIILQVKISVSREYVTTVLILCCVHLDKMADLFFLHLKSLRIVIVHGWESIFASDLKNTLPTV